LEGEGATWLSVSCIDEGIALREAGVSARILVMADFLPSGRDVYQEFRLTPVVHTLDELARVRVPFHLKLDTGMGRLGTRAPAEEIARALKACAGELEGLMTHFASSSNYESPQTEAQIATFQRVRMGLKLAGIVPRYLHAA